MFGVADRFWSKVLKTDTCWLWQRRVNNRGYGCFAWIYPDKARRSQDIYAHRAAWILTHGSIPPGRNVLHRCDTPACVNPAHLFIGSQSDNMRDCFKKHRHPGMPPPPTTKVTPDQVRAIRNDPRKHHIIAADYGLKRLSVLLIKHRKTWRHVLD